jgi:cytidine deaminase
MNQTLLIGRKRLVRLKNLDSDNENVDIIADVIELAKQNNEKFKLASIITVNGRTVASAFNVSKSHPLQYKYAKKVGREEAIYLHAELLCIIRAKGRGDTLIVARVGKNGEVKLAKPCSICMEAIRHETDIRVIHYTISDNEYGTIEIKR